MACEIENLAILSDIVHNILPFNVDTCKCVKCQCKLCVMFHLASSLRHNCISCLLSIENDIIHVDGCMWCFIWLHPSGTIVSVVSCRCINCSKSLYAENMIIVHYNLPWYFTACRCVNHLGCWAYECCLVLVKVEMYWLSKQIDIEFVACQFAFSVFWVIMNLCI